VVQTLKKPWTTALDTMRMQLHNGGTQRRKSPYQPDEEGAGGKQKSRWNNTEQLWGVVFL
jgi:hypothetical protein